MAEVLVSAKVSVFYSKFNKTFPKSSQRFYLARTLIKQKTQPNQRLDQRFIPRSVVIENLYAQSLKDSKCLTEELDKDDKT